MNRFASGILRAAVAAHGELSELERPIAAAFRLIADCFRQGNKLLVCGNGGSAADAEHIVGELMNRFGFHRALPNDQVKRIKAAAGKDAGRLVANLQPALPAISLASQTSLISAVANDLGADFVFAQQVYGYGRPGDVLMAISTSGNSPNVISAALVAAACRMKVIGLSGGNGGRLAKLCNVCILAPGSTTFRVQEFHQIIYHTLCAMLEREFFLPAKQR